MRRQPHASSRGTARPIPRRIVVAVTCDIASRRRIVEGIGRFCEQRPDWDPLLVTQTGPIGPIQETLRRADGVLTTGYGADRQAVIRSLPCPVVVVGGGAEWLPTFDADEAAVGRLAFEHYRDLGLEHLAFCGMHGQQFSDARLASFAAVAGEHGLGCLVYPGVVYAQMEQDPHELEPLRHWLLSLPRPAGLFAATTELAHIVLYHCRVLGLQVPDDVAILGVDDDELLCMASRPRLSCVDQDCERIGFEAAALLSRLMEGAAEPAGPRLVAPAGVVARDSTDTLQIEHPLVARAVRFIRAHAAEGIRVGDVLKEVPLSRRALERGVQKYLGRTAHEEIVRVRVERARRLLRHTDLPLPDIAARCGFSYPPKLSEAFKRETGLTPGAYRRTVRPA